MNFIIDRIMSFTENLVKQLIVALRYKCKSAWLQISPFYTVKPRIYSAIAAKIKQDYPEADLPVFGIDYCCLNCRQIGWSDWLDPWSHQSRFECMHCGHVHFLAETNVHTFYSFYYRHLCWEYARTLVDDKDQALLKITYKKLLKKGIPFSQMPPDRDGKSYAMMETLHFGDVLRRSISS